MDITITTPAGPINSISIVINVGNEQSIVGAQNTDVASSDAQDTKTNTIRCNDAYKKLRTLLLKLFNLFCAKTPSDVIINANNAVADARQELINSLIKYYTDVVKSYSSTTPVTKRFDGRIIYLTIKTMNEILCNANCLYDKLFMQAHMQMGKIYNENIVNIVTVAPEINIDQQKYDRQQFIKKCAEFDEISKIKHEEKIRCATSDDEIKKIKNRYITNTYYRKYSRRTALATNSIKKNIIPFNTHNAIVKLKHHKKHASNHAYNVLKSYYFIMSFLDNL